MPGVTVPFRRDRHEAFMTTRTALWLSLSLNLIVSALALGGSVWPNVETTFNLDVDTPVLSPSTYVHPQASVTGSVTLGQRVFVAPQASVRGDEGQNIHVGDDSNVQDGAVIHGLETHEDGHELVENEVHVSGRSYSVYIGNRVSLAHQSQVHGPAKIGDNTFIGMQALVFKASLGDHVVVEPGAKVVGVKIGSNRYVPGLSMITSQAQADALPVIREDYAWGKLNEAVVRVNTQLAVQGKKRDRSVAKY